MKFDKYMSCLATEMTRRCNMNCKFCGKGQAQNIDITPEIIDKTLDEMNGVYIDSLRISGGEPLLAPDLIDYLIRQIINKHIYINNVAIFTNGTLMIPKLINSLGNLLNYLRKIEPECRQILKWSDLTTEKVYIGTSHAKVNIIISDNERNISQDVINQTLKFYKQIDDEDFSVVKQSDTFKEFGQITLEGNAKKNYRELLGNTVSLKDLRILNNEYCFVTKSANLSSQPFFYNTKFIKKTLTISANGNVFPGCLMAYDRVDESPMFNILDCNNDFFKKVELYCWDHPINEQALNIRNKFAAVEFCRNNNIEVKYMSKSDYSKLKFLSVLVDKYEKICRDNHQMLPNLYFDEIDAIATATLVLEMFEKEIPFGYIKLYLSWCSDFDSDTINRITAEWCRGFILFMAEKDKKRKNN